ASVLYFIINDNSFCLESFPKAANHLFYPDLDCIIEKSYFLEAIGIVEIFNQY
ncbi:15086_t:CDS:1, partial [Funneliformis caledonium]